MENNVLICYFKRTSSETTSFNLKIVLKCICRASNLKYFKANVQVLNFILVKMTLFSEGVQGDSGSCQSRVSLSKGVVSPPVAPIFLCYLSYRNHHTICPTSAWFYCFKFIPHKHIHKSSN